MKTGLPKQEIVQQELALDAYLSRLLDEMPELDENELKVAETRAIPVTKPVQTPVRPANKIKTQVQIASQPLAVFETPAKLHPLSVMPDWAQHEFQALFFKLEHLILATPLTELSRAIKIDQKPGKIPGQPAWFIGLLNEHDSRVGVLDTGQLVFGKSRGGARDLETNPFKSILITQDKRWGLACDEILSIGKVKPEKVSPVA